MNSIIGLASAAASGAGTAASIDISLQAQVDSTQLADVKALFASVGLGAGADSTA